MIRSFSLISIKPGSVSVLPSTPTSLWKEVNPVACVLENNTAGSRGQSGGLIHYLTFHIGSHQELHVHHSVVTPGIRGIAEEEVIKKKKA